MEVTVKPDEEEIEDNQKSNVAATIQHVGSIGPANDQAPFTIVELQSFAAAIIADQRQASVPQWVSGIWAKIMLPGWEYRRLRSFTSPPNFENMITSTLQSRISDIFGANRLEDTDSTQLLLAWELTIANDRNSFSKVALSALFGNDTPSFRKPLIVLIWELVQYLTESPDAEKVASNAALDLLAPEVRDLVAAQMHGWSRSRIISIEHIRLLCPSLMNAAMSTNQYRQLVLTTSKAMRCRMYLEGVLNPCSSFFNRLESKKISDRGRDRGRGFTADYDAMTTATFEVSRVGALILGNLTEYNLDALDKADVLRVARGQNGDQDVLQTEYDHILNSMRSQLKMALCRISQMWSAMHANLEAGHWQPDTRFSTLFPCGIWSGKKATWREADALFSSDEYKTDFHIPAGDSEEEQAASADLEDYLKSHPRFAPAWNRASASLAGNSVPQFQPIPGVFDGGVPPLQMFPPPQGPSFSQAQRMSPPPSPPLASYYAPTAPMTGSSATSMPSMTANQRPKANLRRRRC